MREGKVMQEVPKVGNKHHFFDDGKMSDSRHYIAEVIEVITPEDAKNIEITLNDGVDSLTYTLYQLWEDEVNEHRQGEHPCILVDKEHTKPYAPWLYEETTDFLVKCSIPDYEKDFVWFARTIDGGWFSFNTTNTWMSGRLKPLEFDWEQYKEDERREWEKWKEEHYGNKKENG